MQASTETTIYTQGLTKKYNGFTAVDNLDFVVQAGEIFGLLGPNGAGKTTTILMLLGLSEPSSGSVRVVGLDPTRNPLRVKRQVGYVPDNVGFYTNMTGRENLRYTANLNQMEEKEADSRIQLLLEQVGLDSAGDAKVGTYSRGMRQRLGIADALVKDPRVLILDEPTIGIDPEGLKEILELIRNLREERNVTVLLSSHLLHQVQSICDRVGIFVRGRMIARGPVAQLAEQITGAETTLELAVDDWDAAGNVIQATSGLVRVEREKNYWLITADRDIRADIARRLTERSVAILHMRQREEILDEIYTRYFEGKSDESGNGRR